jgi:hypothetical protein
MLRRRCPTAAMVPHSRRRHIQQSGQLLMWRRQEWGTTAAVVSHLGYDVLTDVVGCCDVCFC